MIVLRGTYRTGSVNMYMPAKPWVRSRRDYISAALVCLIYSFSFLFVLPFMLSDKAHSAFYRSVDPEEKTYVRPATENNNVRVSQAERFFYQLHLKRHDPKKPKPVNPLYQHLSSQNIELLVVVITKRRVSSFLPPGQDLAYVTQTAAGLFEMFGYMRSIDRVPPFNTTELLLCNVDMDIAAYEEAQRLSQFIAMVSRFEEKTMEQHANKYERIKKDYQFCLEKGTALNPKYILILHDDVVPTPAFKSLFSPIIKDKLFNRSELGDWVPRKDDWLYLRLYEPPQNQHYSVKEYHHIIEVLGIAIFGGFFFMLIPIALSCRTNGHSDSQSCYFTIGAIYAVLLVCIIGRPYVLTLGQDHFVDRYHIVYTDSLSTHALLYDGEKATKLAQSLSKTICDEHFNLDLAIEYFTRTHAYSTLLLEPSLFHHIGMVPSQQLNAYKPEQFIYGAPLNVHLQEFTKH